MNAKLRSRQDRNRELAKMDMANRCAKCKIALPRYPVFREDDVRRWCSLSCMTDHLLERTR